MYIGSHRLNEGECRLWLKIVEARFIDILGEDSLAKARRLLDFV